MAKRVYRQDSVTEQVPATLSPEEQELIRLSELNSKFDRSELVVPRVKILQTGSPEAQEDSNQYIPGAKSGMFYNTANGKVTPGQEGMICCIVGHQKLTIEWLPRTTGGGLVKIWGMDDGWKALCEPDQRDVFNPVTKDGHIIDKQRSFLIFDIDTKTGDAEPTFFNMSRTAIPRANRLSSMLTQTRMKMSDGRIITPPYYYYLYKCTLDRISNEKGNWWLPKFEKYGDDNAKHISVFDIPNGKEIYEKAKLFQSQFLEGTIQQESYEQPSDSNNNNDIDGDAVTF